MKRSIYLLIIMLIVLFWLAGGIDGAIERPSMNVMKGTGMSLAYHMTAMQEIGATLGSQFTFEPFNPPLPDHLWMNAGKGEIRFLHFDKPISEADAKLIFIGEGIKGKFCAGDQPEGGKTGFVHFHSLTPGAGEKSGHGGHEGGEGYWLRHVAVSEFDMMGTHFKPGITMNFMPTPPPKC